MRSAILALFVLLLARQVTAAEAGPLILTAAALKPRVPYARNAFDHGAVVFRITLKNLSRRPILVEKHLQDALQIASVRHEGHVLIPVVSSLQIEANDLAPPDHVGLLAPGMEVSATISGIYAREGKTDDVRQTTYVPEGPGDYEVVFEYRFEGHTKDPVFRGPLAAAPATVSLTR
jgi:hypothetical protein